MATDVIRYRRANEATARAAKEKRQKIILVIGVVLLIGLLALELPKTLKKLHHTAAAIAPVPVATNPAVAAPVVQPRPVSLAPLRRFASKDPFVPQIGATTGATQGPLATDAPAVRTSHFIEKDPFVQQLSVTGAATTPATKGGQPTPAAAGNGNYIVIVASVPIGSGHGAAMKAAAAARAHGVASVQVVDSSNYPTLRSGYYAVYSGPYSTLALAQKALASIRGQGYISAYTRILGH
jgi:SPOR domain